MIVLITRSVAGAAFVSPLVPLIVALLLFVGPYRGRRGRARFGRPVGELGATRITTLNKDEPARSA
jgi:hypothetical protein